MNSYINSTDLARKLAAIAHPSRLSILEQLSTGEKNVSELCKELGKEQPYISQHLRQLRAHQIINHRRSGQKIFYSAPKEIYQWIRKGQELLIEVDS
ncbi:MAG TPA: metalloregulator ArsR/SmtB family transcription factor [Candidatus Melainabacteria bacterium]|nr:metalloregulator ArsR/SmtB family transcription factor [Candidatus Melainabacteria bacterium]HMP51263.1 metalloregulator ArsR/SmtB family transcription factor [Candidatus Melainabacteria bacterium]